MFLHDSERVFAETVNQIVHANPFDREQIERLEKTALSIELPREAAELGVPMPTMPEFADLAVIVQRAECVAEIGRRRLKKGKRPDERDNVLYRDLVLFVL